MGPESVLTTVQRRKGKLDRKGVLCAYDAKLGGGRVRQLGVSAGGPGPIPLDPPATCACDVSHDGVHSLSSKRDSSTTRLCPRDACGAVTSLHTLHVSFFLPSWAAQANYVRCHWCGRKQLRIQGELVLSGAGPTPAKGTTAHAHDATTPSGPPSRHHRKQGCSFLTPRRDLSPTNMRKTQLLRGFKKSLGPHKFWTRPAL